MARTRYIKDIEKELLQAKNNLLKFLEKDFNFGIKLVKWIAEMTTKIFIIRYNPKKEKIRRRRREVYWVDFGINVGSEFNEPHFCVVIKEFDHTVIGIPLSSKKEDDAEWKCDENFIVEIGCLDDLPDNECQAYAMVNQIRSLSKQRLNVFKHKGSAVKIKLNSDQMDKIDKCIQKLCKN